MNKKGKNIESLLNEFKIEQKRFKETLKKLDEKQKKFNDEQALFNQQVAEQNKKNKRFVLVMMFICLFVSGITSVLSYTLGASSVEYTAKDSNWHVENTQEAIDDLYNSLGSALVGSVYSYMGVNVPFGYLACDGSTYNIEDYPRLANHIKNNFGSYNYFGGNGTTTFAVPDLRGEFLRGSGNNSRTNQGSGTTVGVHQDATKMPNYTGYDAGSYKHMEITGSSSVVNADTTMSDSSYVLYVDAARYNSTYQSFTVRPTNTSVLYIIKY